MALFGGSRDISLFHNLNNELLKDIIQTEAAYYKFALEQTTSNIYDNLIFYFCINFIKNISKK